MPQRVRFVPVLALALGCGHGAPADSGGTQPPATGSEVSLETLAAVCAGPCAGPFAQVRVWRDAAGAVGRIVVQGDIQVCSDPPMVYYDANGTVSEQIGLEPVEPGSPEAQAFADRRARQLEGLTEAERLSCP